MALSLRSFWLVVLFSAGPPAFACACCTHEGQRNVATAAGSGVFRPGIAPRQLLTLILQGGGDSCTSANDFSHWTLVMRGAKANYTLFGELVTTK